MTGRARSRIAIALAIALAATGIAMLATMTSMTVRATGLDPNPAGAAKQQDGAEAVDDGFPPVDWGYWLAANPDIVGWVTVPGTGIDYPVVQGSTDDPTHYLYHDAYGNWNYHGTPYLSWECEEGGLLGGDNALVFGHHLQDGTMFSALAGFIDAGYAEEHSPILVQTPDEKAKLQVIAIDVVAASTETVKLGFETAEAQTEWLRKTVANADLALAPSDFDYSSAISVVTLCTCSYSRWSNERTLVYCTPQEVIPND